MGNTDHIKNVHIFRNVYIDRIMMHPFYFLQNVLLYHTFGVT